MPESGRIRARAAVEALQHAGLTVAVAESLTGGGVASALTAIPGCSAVFRGGAVTYDAQAKAQVLGVSTHLLAERGPVDPDVALAMARGARRLFATDVAVATTGVAGPASHGGHPPGSVYLGWVTNRAAGVIHAQLPGSRDQVRPATVDLALQVLAQCAVGGVSDVAPLGSDRELSQVRSILVGDETSPQDY